jgi:protein gp37
MAESTKIQWAHHTFNPWRGCAKVHTGCANCYAEREAIRFPANRGIWGPKGTRVRADNSMWRQPLLWNAKAAAARQRRRVFCASLADVFEAWDGPINDHKERVLYRCSHCGANWAEGEPTPCSCGGDRFVNQLTMPELRLDLFDLIDLTPWLDWLLVTKRPERIRASWRAVMRLGADGAEIRDGSLYRPNVWLLTSVSDQETADLMVPRLLECRDLVPVLGVSAEPLLGPIDFTDWIGCECSESLGHCDSCLNGRLDWIILGGESARPGDRHGSSARPCDVAWLLNGIMQCEATGVACFLKQYGSNAVSGSEVLPRRYPLKHPKGGDPLEWREEMRVRQFPNVALKGVVA